MKIKTNIYLNIKSLFIYNMSKILTAGMKRRATYESLVRDTILEPKDKIKLPNREASILRRTQQLSRYDDFLGLETVNEKINKERIKQLELAKLVEQKPMGTMAVERARQSEVKSYDIGSDVQYNEEAYDIHEIREQDAIRMATQNIRGILEQAELNSNDESLISSVQRHISTSKPPTATDTPQEIPQQIEQSSVSRKVKKNLGIYSETSDPKYMEVLTSQTLGTSSKDTPGASSSSKDVPIAPSDNPPPEDIKGLQIDMVIRRLQAALNSKIIDESKEELQALINEYTAEETIQRKRAISAKIKEMYITPSIWENLIPISTRIAKPHK